MKLKILISLFFIITTTFATVHEVQHTEHSDDIPCLVCHVVDSLTSSNIVDNIQHIEKFHSNKVLENNSILSFHTIKYSNQNRAPPLAS